MMITSRYLDWTISTNTKEYIKKEEEGRCFLKKEKRRVTYVHMRKCGGGQVSWRQEERTD